jgi:hypothetical protein
MVVKLNLNDSFRCFLYFIFYLATYYKNIGHIIKYIVERLRLSSFDLLFDFGFFIFLFFTN